jgi:hypothetical protein
MTGWYWPALHGLPPRRPDDGWPLRRPEHGLAGTAGGARLGSRGSASRGRAAMPDMTIRLKNQGVGTMLRWVIAFLLIANVAAFAAVSGAFGPLPSAGDLEPGHVGSQVHPEHLDVQLTAANTPLPASAVVGAPVSTVTPDATSLPASGAVDSAASTAAPGQAANAASGPSAASAASSSATSVASSAATSSNTPATSPAAIPANTPAAAASNGAASNAAAASPAPAASAPSAPSSAAR